MCDEGEILTNAFSPRDMKTLLSDHYGEDIQIIHNTIKSKSDIIFSSKIKPTDLALKIRNQNIMQECGKTLRHILMKVDFGLQDSFCDSADLRASWENTLMPPPLTTFLAALFNVPAYKLFQSNSKDLEDIEDLLNGDNDDDNDEDDDDDDDDDDGDLNDDRDLDTDERIRPEDEEQHSHQHDFHRLVGPGGDAPSHVVTDTRNPFLKTHQKSIVFQNIFQMFVYNIHNGRRKTPLHMPFLLEIEIKK